ncbi:left-right determination factor 2-like protein, partial [Corchorus olitorius]
PFEDHARHRNQRGRDHRPDGGGVVAVAVPVAARGAQRVEIVDMHLLPLHEVVVRDQDAEQRADERAQHVDRVVDHLGVVVEVPGRDEDRCDCRDHAARAPADVLRRHVGKVERRRHEVGDDVDADGRDHE